MRKLGTRLVNRIQLQSTQQPRLIPLINTIPLNRPVPPTPHIPHHTQIPPRIRINHLQHLPRARVGGEEGVGELRGGGGGEGGDGVGEGVVGEEGVEGRFGEGGVVLGETGGGKGLSSDHASSPLHMISQASAI